MEREITQQQIAQQIEPQQAETQKLETQKAETQQIESQQAETQKEEVQSQQRMRYEDAHIDDRILRAVKEMGFEVMTPIQEQAIPVLLEGKDVIGQAQTGTGKTAAFAIPMIQRINADIKRPQGIILCPTRELAMQAAEEIRKLTRYMHGVKVLPVYGGQDIGRQIRSLSQGVQIIVGTPGRVMDHLRRHTIKTSEIRMIVLDEADEMLNMGFREDIETVLKDMPKEHQMALFSATMPQAILDITGTYQKNAVYVKVTPREVTVAAIKQAYYRVARKDKFEAICRLLDYYHPEKSLVFCNTKKMVDEITGMLKDRGYEAEGLHGDLTQNQRDTVMNLFRSGRCRLLSATDVAARGIDVSGVDAVFNYDVPEDIEYYVHRIGRTGRAGKAGRSFTLVSGREIFKIHDIERICHTTIKERKIPSAKDIVKIKSGKLFADAMEVMENTRLDEIRERIVFTAEENGFSVLDLAAAFMYMNMGEEPVDIREEKPFYERSGRHKSNSKDAGRRPGHKDKKSFEIFRQEKNRQDKKKSYGKKDSKKRNNRNN